VMKHIIGRRLFAAYHPDKTNGKSSAGVNPV